MTLNMFNKSPQSLIHPTQHPVARKSKQILVFYNIKGIFILFRIVWVVSLELHLCICILPYDYHLEYHSYDYLGIVINYPRICVYVSVSLLFPCRWISKHCQLFAVQIPYRCVTLTHFFQRRCIIAGRANRLRTILRITSITGCKWFLFILGGYFVGFSWKIYPKWILYFFLYGNYFCLESVIDALSPEELHFPWLAWQCLQFPPPSTS